MGATDAYGDAGERRGKGRATAAAGQPLYICAGRLSDPRWPEYPRIRECLPPLCLCERLPRTPFVGVCLAERALKRTNERR